MSSSPTRQSPGAAETGALLDALRGLAWPARAAILGGIAGTHKSRLRGLSAEFTEYRPYRQGDDPRRLDWKLLARTDRAYLRITNDRATITTMLVIDASASMAFPAGTLAKWRMARLLAIGLAAVAQASGDPVGVIVAGGDLRGARQPVIPPRTRRGVVAEIARLLDGVGPGGSGPLSPVLATLRGTPRIVLISDFLGDEAAARRAARELVAGGSEIHAIEVVAREELAPPSGAFLATDPEESSIRRPMAAETRQTYSIRFNAWRRETARAWRAAAATWAEVTDDEAPARAVRRIVRAHAPLESHA